jgi:hypothetical protein
MQDEILIKFKLEQDGLDASFKEIQNNLTNKVNNLENELSSKFKEVAKQSGGALDPFLEDIDEIVKDANKLKIITKVIEGNAASLDKNSKEFKALNGLLKEFNSKSLELSRAKKSFEEIGNEVEKINAKPLTFFDKMKNSLSGGQGITALVGGFVGGLASAGLSLITNGISSLANSIVETTAKYQRFEAVLTNTLGSNSSAQKAMKDIIDFASRTPFQVDELTDSFVKFANRGINLTITEMTKLGDIAASQGKSFNQLTEAVLDAQTGEFERLKEFGIRASKEGDKVTLSFKGITKEVANNEDAIKNAILSYGELEGVAGGMEAISKTLGGSLSNLGDSLDKFFASIGSRIGVSLSGAISTLSEMVSKFSDFIAVKEDTIKVGIEASFQNKAEAESAQILLNEYESLKEKGVKATSAEKKRMTDITYTLRDSLGESVVAINKETGALEVNIAATKQAIKQKILLSNTELAKVALEFNNAKAQEQAANAELKRINDTRKSKNDALLNDEKNFSKRRSLLEQESQSDFLSLVPLRNAANEQSKILAKAQETIKKTRDELAKFGFSVGDFDFDELAKSAISSNKKSETAITKTSDEEKAKRKKQEKDFNDYVDKLEDDAAKKLFKQWEDEEKAQEQLDNYLEKSLEDNAKKQFESWENEKKNIASVAITLGDAYKRGYQTAEEYQAELLEKQKQAVNELIEFAQNGILLQIGLNPADVSKVKSSIENLQNTLDKEGVTPAEKAAAAAQAAGAVASTVSNAIFAADTQRRQEELAALQAQQEEELRLAGDNEQKKDLIKQKYALKEKDIKRKQAEADKKKAMLDIVINTAVAVVKAFATTGPIAGPVFAAIVGALGLAQLALVAAQPIPKFEKGGAVPSSDIQGMISGKPHVAGGVLIEAEGNEFITRRSQAMKGDNLGLLEAINMSDSERDAYINRHYVMPALQAKESEAAKSYRSSIIEAENNLIARMSGHTLKSIDRRLVETNQSIKGLAKKDYTW